MNCIWITTDSFRQDHVHAYRPEGTLDDSKLEQIESGIEKAVNEAIEFAEKGEFPPASAVCEYVYAGKF